LGDMITLNDGKLEVFRVNCQLDKFSFYNKGYETHW